MNRSLTRKSIVVGAGGMLAAGLLAAAATATAANAATVKDAAPAARGPAWHAILSAANGRSPNQIDTVLARLAYRHLRARTPRRMGVRRLHRGDPLQRPHVEEGLVDRAGRIRAQ